MSLRRIHQIPLEWSCHCLTPVFVFNVLRSVPHFMSFCPRLPARVSLFSCQTFSILSASILVFLTVISNEVSSCEVTALMPIPPRLVGSFILVQPSSSSDLSSNFSQCLQVGVPRPRPAWFSTVLCHLQPRQHSSPGKWFVFQASLLHSSISSFIFFHSSSGKSSLGNFAWIIFVVSSPAVACLLPNMICFVS